MLSKKLNLDQAGGVSSEPLGKKLSESDTKFILRMDEIEEICRNNHELFTKANSLCKNIEDLYSNLSDKIFSLADVYHKMSSNYKKLETFTDFESQNLTTQLNSSLNQKPKSQISECFNFLKITLYAWSNSYKLNSGGIQKIVQPFCNTNIDRIQNLKDTFKLKKGLVAKHQALCTKSGADSTIKIDSDSQPHPLKDVS